nr:MAG TPA: DNA-binding protein [Caudoviricetes sp.]
MYNYEKNPTHFNYTDIVDNMHRLDPRFTKTICRWILSTFIVTVRYFLRHGITMRIKGFIQWSTFKIAPKKIISNTTGAEYNRPEYTSIGVKVDRVLKDTLNRRRTGEQYGEPVEIVRERELYNGPKRRRKQRYRFRFKKN